MNIELNKREYSAALNALIIYADRKETLLRGVLGSNDVTDIKLAQYWLPEYIGARELLAKLGYATANDPVFRFREGLLVEERSEDEQGAG